MVPVAGVALLPISQEVVLEEVLMECIEASVGSRVYKNE
jgi:hypothetical protein